MEDKVQLVQGYMATLLQTGFSVEEVLARGIDYLEHYLIYETGATATTDIDLLIAQTVLQAAKNLHIDAESQQQAYLRLYSGSTPITPMEFKKIYGNSDESHD